MYKVLNLYACLGGNRLLWTDCQVTAIEIDDELARLYKIRFPNDIVIVTDAHQYLINNYKNFDFIWSSPPCPTHSRARHSQKNTASYKPEYPSMVLYQEIIFLKTHFKGLYVVENVIPYYQPLIPAQARGRHLYWLNFTIPKILSTKVLPKITNQKNLVDKLCKFHGIDLSTYKGWQRKDKIARNLVCYEAGETIFKTARKLANTNSIQLSIF